MVQIVKNLPTVRETQVQSLGQEDALEKRMATHSNILAWRIPWTEEPGRATLHGSQRVGHDSATNTHFCCSLFFLEGRWLERGHFILSLSYFLTFAPSNFFSTLSLEGAFYNANLIVTFSPENLSVASNDTRFSHIRF